ncbi:BREX system P-loop protein BrxC [Thiothrix lacustris]|uniref:BREX system P-loop protein BrxC n=1 Tax=Thiothrix lacustris TaxID=525917 RepID=A0ABY9MRG7_9GAMM|nr:BREX system P-loop protein BrxC [Thiothrix lacustris]WML91012.1 BREX system P-loop protein BrxC [Thiothrix lacustris]
MLNRDVYLNDPLQNKLANNGVAEVKDDQSQVALETLAYELRTFVCDGAYERGMAQILGSFLSNVQTTNEQPGVWISGFFGSGKSHLAKMLRTLWVNQTFSDGRDARGMTELPAKIGRYFEELSAQAPRFGGLHAASGTFGEGLKDLVRPALLAIVFRSVDLPEQYHLARFVMWLKANGIYEAVRAYIESHVPPRPGVDPWKKELSHLMVSTVFPVALLDAMPSIGSDAKEVRQMLLAQFPAVKDVSNHEMVDAIVDALAVNGQLPLTLIVIDEVQQYLGDDPQRAMDVQEAIETCCKASALKSRVLFVATGQSALSGKQNLQRLMGRFQVNVQLEDTDVDAVIRKVILQKKESARPQLEQVVQDNLGEISRHLRGSRIEYHRDDEQWMVADYPLLPVRRRFWERILQVLDKTGTGSQLRNQLRIVHEATKITAEQPLGHVVPADFVYEQNAVNLMNTGVIGRDIYENISRLKGGNAEQHLQGRLLSLILLINKLPNDIEHGIAATADALADLLLDDLQAGSHDLRTRIPALLKQLEDDRLVLSMQTRVGEEYRLQTAESQLWYDMYRQQMNDLRANPQRLEAFRAQEIQSYIRKHVTQARITQGKVAEARTIHLVFESELPADADKKICAWIPEVSEQQFLASARGADPESATIFIYVPTAFRTELNTAIVELKAAETTLEVRGVPGTDAGKEARSAMEHRLKEAERSKKAYLKDIFAQIQVKLAGGADVPGETLTQQVEAAAQTAAERLYREFYSVDVPGWGTVYNRASKEGGENALEAIGHQEEAAKHPVVIAIKRYVGVMKTGKEIRDNFKQAPYGWPQDTIDGALYAMLAAGILKGADTQEKPVDAKNLDRGKVGMTKFRPETVVISTVQLIKVRSLINALGVSCTAGEEASKLPQAVAAAKQAARSAGGDAPLPPAPNPVLLNELEVLAGNSQLQLAYEHKDQLQADFESWKTQAEQIHQRKVQWSLLGDAMQHCKGLVIYAQLDTERHAILQNRSLLANPNPVEPLIKQAMTAVREAITAHLDKYEQEYHACMHDLDADGTWVKLDSAQQQTLLKQHHLDDIPVEKLSGNEAVLESIERTSLQQWNDRTAALPGRFEYVRKAAVSALQPKVQHVRVERATLENEQQLQAWLKATEVQLRAELNKGPVAIS